METNQTTGVRHESATTPITLDKIYKADYQKEGTLTAQIRQTVTTKSFYPSKKTSNNLQANIFSNEDFGFEEQEFTSTEERVAWLPVPANAKQAEVAKKLAAASAKGACIYRVLSNVPILSEDQKYAISQSLRTMDDFANSQVVRYPEGTKDKDDNDISGQIVLDKAGNVQYRRTFFWNTPMDDQDARDANDVYISAELEAELSGASVMTGQVL